MSVKSAVFCAAMTQAIRDDLKTQTRRVMKPQPIYDFCHEQDSEWFWTERDADDDMMGWWPDYYKGLKPRYLPGDILWVQEAWKCVGVHGDYGYEVEFPDGTRVKFKFSDMERAQKWMKYHGKNGWQSPYFMPREAARTFLLAKGTRPERVQEISESDAKAEGIKSYFLHMEHGGEWHPSNSAPFVGIGDESFFTRKEAYKSLWNSLNAKRDGGMYAWEMNPWVWVYSFERISKPADWPLTA